MAQTTMLHVRVDDEVKAKARRRLRKWFGPAAVREHPEE